MMNFTSIDYLTNKDPQKSGGFKEGAPYEEKKPEEQVQQVDAETNEQKEIDDFIEEVPNAPDVPPDLKKIGVQSVQPVTGSIFVGNKKIDLPLPLEEIDDGLRKPVSSGKRWLAEFLRYILSRLHLVIKKIHGTLTVVHK